MFHVLLAQLVKLCSSVRVMLCMFYKKNVAVLSQEIGWEEHLRNDLFCVECGVKPYSVQFHRNCVQLKA